MRDEPLSLDQLQRPLDDLRNQLTDKGWEPFKTHELKSPDGQWSVRTGYSGGETYLRVNRFDQARKDRHLSEVDPFEQVAYLRIWPRMDEDPYAAIRGTLEYAGVQL